MKATIAKLVALAAAVLACATPLAANASGCDSTMAFVMSQRAVKNTLKAPSTASFPLITANGVKVMRIGGEGCSFQVIAYVDAQNSYGAKVRSSYAAAMVYNPAKDTWRASALSVL